MELATLRALRDEGTISRAEYDSAMHDVGDSAGEHGGDLTVVLGKVAATLYGFVEADALWDSTQSFSDLAGNAQVAAPGSLAGQRARTTFGVRGSRLGTRVRVHVCPWLRASGVVEMDFLGATPSASTDTGTQAATFSTPGFRLRHAYLKVETPIVDVLFGQYWHLFGWQASYFPNTVEMQGLVGQLYSRTPQLRISKRLGGEDATFEIAVAGMRPPQPDAATPEGEAGLRLTVERWATMQTLGATGTRIAPLSIALTGDVRKVSANALSATPTSSSSATGAAVAVDAFVPILPATEAHRGNALALSGEVVYGKGMADLYAGLTGGVSNPALPNPTMKTPAPTYAPDVDPGIAVYDAKGQLQLVQWTTFNVGAQYYFPGLKGHLWVSGNYARAMSSNAKTLGTAAKVRDHEERYDANLFGDPVSPLRLGLAYARYNDTYADGTKATNHRVQLSGFVMF